MSLVILTGASKGFGACIARALAESWLVKIAPVDFVLTGRDLAGLNETRQAMIRVSSSAHGNLSCVNPIDVVTIGGDFSNPDSLDDVSESILAAAPKSTYTRSLLINNAGVMTKIERIRSRSAKDIRAELDTNILAPAVLTSHFLRRFGDARDGTWLINISSLAAVAPLDTMGLYSTGKAARDMFFRCVALEEDNRDKELHGDGTTSRPRVRALSYAPGPMETQMQKQIRSEMPDVGLRGAFMEMHEKNTLVDPLKSALTLVSILEWDQYENGAHIDIYDVGKLLPSEFLIA
ncbi:hypothetical protein BJ742DRAFT_686068 [Cladochytrium replicatum]|nr:hypothetical protein BJ742DRAFT_686068 [Cladochytrium replicatum]